MLIPLVEGAVLSLEMWGDIRFTPPPLIFFRQMLGEYCMVLVLASVLANSCYYLLVNSK